MKRRDFLTVTGAALSAPFLPAPTALARTAPSAGQMALASHLARYNPQVTAAGIARVLNVPSSTATQIIGEMTRQGVIRQAGFSGAREAMRSMAERVLAVEEDVLEEDFEVAVEGGAEEE
jgi:isopentenyl diphosphate isomerase/L-lactate dehydrogenase-like FMN-dependent dehydrogenase